MKKFGFLLIVAALFGMLSLSSCKPKAAEPAETTEEVAPAPETTDEGAMEEAPAEEAPAEEAPAQ